MTATPPVLIRAVTGAPWTGADIVRELRRVHGESVEYWTRYPAPAFFRRPTPDVWAPVDQVRHLTKSMRAIVVGFRAPRVLLTLRYGLARRPSRSCQQLETDYEERLKRGVKAGPFSPSEIEASEQNDEGRARVMRYHAIAVDNLSAVVIRWSERSLDRFVMPHPVLGKLTAREMAMFALIHNVHHVHVAERRRVSGA